MDVSVYVWMLTVMDLNVKLPLLLYPTLVINLDIQIGISHPFIQVSPQSRKRSVRALGKRLHKPPHFLRNLLLLRICVNCDPPGPVTHFHSDSLEHVLDAFLEVRLLVPLRAEAAPRLLLLG